MNKIILTSSGINRGDLSHFSSYVGKPIYEIKIAFIPTAADPEKDKKFLFDGMDELKDFGLSYEIYDIKGKTTESIKNELERFDVIWVNGGNTFYLLDQVRKSGFDKAVTDLLSMGKTYLGVSAGSIIAGPSIELAGWNPDWDKNDAGIVDFGGLNLVDFVVSPHYNEVDRFVIEPHLKEVDYSVVALRDGEVIFMESDYKKFVVQENINFLPKS